jgi:Na+-transporting NADH:ubiquinone oxidoreductase subunit C
MAKKSNSYVLIYTIILTVVCGSLLGIASQALKPFKEANEAFDTKKNILGTTMDLTGKSAKEVNELYSKLVVASYVVDASGKKLEITVDKVSVSDEYPKPIAERKLPVYEIADPAKPGEVGYYVFPMWGFGLWDSIWGYVALKSDLKTIEGTIFLHKGETPGLGARITEKEIQSRFKGKSIMEGSDLTVVQMQKGEGNDYSGKPHKVDGMSGATITAVGLNKMLVQYFEAYKSYMASKSGGEVSLVTQ